MEETPRRSVCLVDIDIAIRKGLTFYQIRLNAIVLQGTLPAYCIPKVVRLKYWRSLIWKSIHGHLDHHQRSRSVTIGLKKREEVLLGSKDRQPQEKVARQAKFFQPTQPIPKPISDRSGQLDNTQGVFVVRGETSRSQEISVKSFHEELCSSDWITAKWYHARRDQCSNMSIWRKQECQSWANSW